MGGEGRRAFLRQASAAATWMLTAPAFSLVAERPPDSSPSTPQEGAPDYRIEIADTEWELAPKKRIRTAAYGGKIPGQLIRLTEGKTATIEIVNRLDRPEIVHWHGQWIPSDVDGSMEEGSPMIPAGASTRISFTPRPAGLHWYHTHAMANHNLKHGLYTGQAGLLLVEPKDNPGRYDREEYVVLHDWLPYYSASDDGSLMVKYDAASINGRMLGQGEPIRVQAGERVLFQILNASATEVHWLTLPGHRFEVLALDGSPVAKSATVESLRLGPAERVTAAVTMNAPGVWVLGEPRQDFRQAGMGTVLEYAGQSGKPQPVSPEKLAWDYGIFGAAADRESKPDLTVPMTFTSRFQGHGALDKWMINGKSYPDVPLPALRKGVRYRLIFDNRSVTIIPFTSIGIILNLCLSTEWP